MKAHQLHWHTFIFLFILFASMPCFGSKPRLKTYSTFSQFERGKLKNMSILHDGKLALAPQQQRLIDTGEPFVWSVVSDKKGNTFLGTGNDGKVFKVSALGDSSLFFDAPELEIYALAVDSKNNVYAASSPEGKVYKISSQGHADVFFDPEDVYIWDLVFDGKDRLFVATGENAAIYAVDPDGKASALLKSDQKHIRCLALDKDDRLYAGSSGSGYVYTFLADGKSFVLFDTQMQEVQDIEADGSGYIYAAAYGESGAAMEMAVRQAAKATQKSSTANAQNPAGGVDVTLATQSIAPETPLIAAQVRTSLFKINQDGYARDIWTQDDDHIQTLKMNGENGLFVGTGERGRLYKVNTKDEIALVLTTEESQVSKIYIMNGGSILLSTANLGRGYKLITNSSQEASFESETIDTGGQSMWGVITYQGTVDKYSIDFYTRSGNTEVPENTWSSWQRVEFTEDNIYKIKSPVSRFIQWKCTFHKAAALEQYVEKVAISYLQNNLSPIVTSVVISPQGDYYEAQSNAAGNSQSQENGQAGLVYPQPLPKSSFKKGYRTVDWMFEDPNFDGLSFDLYYKKVGDKDWRELKKNVDGSFYSWDSAQMSDGDYQIKVVASDSPTNPPELSLASERVSDPFTVDNTPPQIGEFSTKKEGENIYLTFRVKDQLSTIAKLYYSVNVDEWQSFYPVDNICDSKIEECKIAVPARGEPVDVSIKAVDQVGNLAIEHTVVTRSDK
jgi:hypothetical protein